MAGIKGRSGRPHSELVHIKDIVVMKAWRKVKKKLKEDDPQAHQIAAAIVIKSIVSQIDSKHLLEIPDSDRRILNTYIKAFNLDPLSIPIERKAIEDKTIDISPCVTIDNKLT